ncbi:MAG: EAL domain-containing protein [Propionibacteriales bacterium]|nr:EAL domain-containing protein [Propionibacteriales bacterium]
MVQEEKLSAVLSDFARTLATDFPIQGILDHLVERIVDVLPVTSAGVTLISEGSAPRYVAASDEAALRFERLQTKSGEGPCLLAYESGEAVSVADLTTDDRFPSFAPQAVAAGLVAVFTFPLRHVDGRLGALDLYRDVPGGMGAHDMSAAQTLADVTSAYLLNAQARDEARTSTERLRQTSLHDALTGLPNRLLLQERLEHATHRAQRSHTMAAILFVDLDRFKQVNDTKGHRVGDELLLAVARRLTAVVRPGDTVARISGDEFVLLCEELETEKDGTIVAERVVNAFTETFVLESAEITISASVGVAFAGPGEDISDHLVARADSAMYQAKRRGGASHQVIDLREAVRATDHHDLELDLRAAFAHDKLEIAYQPIVRSGDGLVTGVEALLRWTDSDRGPVPAVSMVKIAEQSSLISEIGAWVLERSCDDRGQWLQQYPDAPLDLAVNVSARQLMTSDFSATVASVLSNTGMDPTALVLEMTEYILMEDSERAMEALSGLKELGIRLALDDFGTGYSSLSYLRWLPIDIVKIDQGFIADIGHASEGPAIAAAVTNLAHVLGLAVTAEGVETQSQRDEINMMGCDSAQGFFYARPMSAAAIGAQFSAVPAMQLHLP